MTPEMPIACSLNATELRTRLDQISALGHDALLRTDPDGTMHFRPDRATRDRLEAVIDAEARCCSFLHFELGEDRDTLTLRVVAPEGAEAVARDLTAAFAAATMSGRSRP